MEVLPCSGSKYVGDSECAQPSSGTDFIYERQLDSGVDRLLNDGGVPEERQEEGQDDLPISESHDSGSSFYENHLGSQILSSGSHDFEDDDLNAQNYSSGPSLAPENSHPFVDTIGSDSPINIKEGVSTSLKSKLLENDESVALWVKWRGKWQAGIRCARVDWPLQTLKAKPTHDRKQYFVIFFPHTRLYSWADMLLVRSINEFPEPIAYRSHKAGLKMVKDLTIARRYIMQKLAVAMLNIVDQFHLEALIETARDVNVWKEFATEASRCNGYQDLGRMLLKLQSMIFHTYLNSDWMGSSFHSWVQRCQNAQSAESIELLNEELFDSILWNEVKSLRDASVQFTLGSEWRTWKHEVMKLFSTSHPTPPAGDVGQRGNDGSFNLQFSRKRPKLEIRRAESHASQVQTNVLNEAMAVEIDSDFFSSRDIVNGNSSTAEFNKVEDFRKDPVTPDALTGRWDGITAEARNSELVKTKDVAVTPLSEEHKGSMELQIYTKDLSLTPVHEAVPKRSVDLGSKNRQCTAYIESKGRQCVRWANDGDVYCCVHLASRFSGGSAPKSGGTPSVDSPMCEGTTVLGTRCKHRSLFGSSFCKKHGPKSTSYSIEHTPKRKHEEIIRSSETTYCKDLVLLRDGESPLQVEPVSVVKSDVFHGSNSLVEKPEHSGKKCGSTVTLRCIGFYSQTGFHSCDESPKRFSSYCDNHLPSWLKRARNGKSRILSKEVFLELSKECSSLEQKLHLHQACELFYKFFKSVLSLRNPVPMDVQLQWALSEATNDLGVGELLMKLVSREKERLERLWDFNAGEGAPVSSLLVESAPFSLPMGDNIDNEETIRCKTCSMEFHDEEELAGHWLENHKKEAQWYFRGYACAICLDSFTNKKVLESHVQERHHGPFVEHCLLLQCIPCGSHFGNNEQLWSHVLSTHSAEIRHSKVKLNLPAPEGPPPKLESGNKDSVENGSKNSGGARKLICRFCGLKFDLLPDLGRHHQAAHMGPSLMGARPLKKGIRYYAYKLKSGRLSRPQFKKGLGAVSYRIRNRATATIKKRLQASKPFSTGINNVQPPVAETQNLGPLAGAQCSEVAAKLLSIMNKAKHRPSNADILSIVRTSCCKVSLKVSLENKYGVLPQNVYLKAAKLCSEHNIQVEWHQEGFLCANGCKLTKDPDLISPLVPLPNSLTSIQTTNSFVHASEEWDLDECHCIIDSQHLRKSRKDKVRILCDDISSGKEAVPVACVVDEGLLDSLYVPGDSSGDQNARSPMPWKSFMYITKPVLDQSLSHENESFHLGCGCSHSACSPEKCDHVYLFDTDYEDARDIYGKSMHGRFPYDDKGRIILEEGYLVYECNHRCSCDRKCPNRVLQNGVQVKLEVFKTENKGWGVRAAEPILRGTFVCEYIGETLDEQEANKRFNSYGRKDCIFTYKMDSHNNDMTRLIEGEIPFVIDATKYGNVARFINHSCSPNLLHHQVLVESMDSPRAHIGLYASRDIDMGEELTFDYRYNQLPGKRYHCLCGASNCRGHLH